MTVILEQREHQSTRNLRMQKQYRAVCSYCGPVMARWVVGRWFAEDKAAAHEPVCPSADRRPVLIGTYEHGSQAWHDARRAGLGGSEIAAVLGLSPWQSHFSLWHAKAGRYAEDRVNDEMTAGTLLEPVIRAKFASDHPAWGMLPNAGTWRHRLRPWQIANPDAVLSVGGGQGALLETKFSLFADGFGAPGTDEIPIYYRCQVQWYLDVFGLDRCYLMVFVGSSAQFREYVIDADAEDQQRLRDAGAAFMASLESGVRPPLDGHDKTYEVVRALHPDIAGGDVNVPAELAEAYCQAKHAETAAAVAAKLQTARLADFMGSAARAVIDGDRVIARRQAKGGGVPYVVAAKDLPFGAVRNLEAAS